jgi:hypothetical protein
VVASQRPDYEPCPPSPAAAIPDISQETWRVYYGDVHAGTIAQCVGNPGAPLKWQWRWVNRLRGNLVVGGSNQSPLQLGAIM